MCFKINNSKHVFWNKLISKPLCPLITTKTCDRDKQLYLISMDIKRYITTLQAEITKWNDPFLSRLNSLLIIASLSFPLHLAGPKMAQTFVTTFFIWFFRRIVLFVNRTCDNWIMLYNTNFRSLTNPRATSLRSSPQNECSYHQFQNYQRNYFSVPKNVRLSLIISSCNEHIQQGLSWILS